jgi:hypothetical protein
MAHVSGQTGMSDIKRCIRIPDDLHQVSDHAVVRYLERFQGYDFNPVRAEILSPVVRAAIAQGITLLRHSGIEYKISYTPTQAWAHAGASKKE